MSEETAKDIYQQLNELKVIVARIDERTSKSSEEHEKFEERMEEHDRRIRALEDARNKGAGVIAALTAVGSAVGAFSMWALDKLTK